MSRSRFAESALLPLSSIVFFLGFAHTAPALQATALSILPQVSQSFSQRKPVNSVTLNATAQWIAGSDNETGSAVLTSAADGSSRIQLQLPRSSRTESRTSFASGQSCSWSGSDGVEHATSGHNCMETMAWFMPTVALLGSQQPSQILTTVTSAPKGPYVDIRQQWMPPANATSDVATLMAHLGTSDLYVDPVTYLPSSLAFNTHPDDNGGSDIPVQIVFANYQAVQGVMIPFRIQRYVNGTLSLDLTVTQASVN